MAVKRQEVREQNDNSDKSFKCKTTKKQKKGKGLNAPFDLVESWLLILPDVIVLLVEGLRVSFQV